MTSNPATSNVSLPTGPAVLLPSPYVMANDLEGTEVYEEDLAASYRTFSVQMSEVQPVLASHTSDEPLWESNVSGATA